MSRWQTLASENCSIARTLSVIGERWTILILRECFAGQRRFEGFDTALGLPRRVLSARLKTLVAEDILRRRAYQERPVRHEYRLTAKGTALYPVLLALMAWGDLHMGAEGEGPPLILRHQSCGAVLTAQMCCAQCGEEVGPNQVMPL